MDKSGGGKSRIEGVVLYSSELQLKCPVGVWEIGQEMYLMQRLRSVRDSVCGMVCSVIFCETELTVECEVKLWARLRYIKSG